MSDGGSYSLVRWILLVLTHDYINTHTNWQWRTWMVERRGRWLRTIIVAVWGEGSAVCLGLRQASQRSPYTNCAKLVLHRQTLAHERRKGTRKGSIEVGHFSVFMHPASLAVDKGRAPLIRSAPRGGGCLGGRSLILLYAEFRARNH